jgi:hypothetical protein
VQPPQDAAEHLAVVAPWLAAPAVSRQQRLDAGEGLVGELKHRPSPGWWTSRSATLSANATISSKVRLQY